MPSKMFTSLREVAGRVKRDVMTVYFAARDPRTPIAVRMLAFFIAAYALSPIDLIPDFIPVIGYLDDFILVPLGIFLVIKLTPEDVLKVSRAKAAEVSARPASNGAALMIVTIWLASGIAFGYWVWHTVGT